VGGGFVPLTTFVDIRPEHRIAQEEIFGPVLAIIKVSNFDEAIQAANSTQYALTGAVFSRSPENIAKAKREFRAGNLYINRGCTGALVERHPSGLQDVRDWFQDRRTGLPAAVHGPRNMVENTMRRGFAPTDDERYENERSP